MPICSYALFLLRDQGMIERLKDAMCAALVDKKFWRTPSKIKIHMRKNSVVTVQNLESIKKLFDSQTKLVSQEL